MLDKPAIIRAAATCIGWPYLEKGRAAQGVDCFGLLLHLFRCAGVELEDVEIADSGELAQHFAMRFERVSAEEWAEAGDVVLMRRADRLHHVGVSLGGPVFIHATERFGVVQSSMRDYRLFILGVYRLKL